MSTPFVPLTFRPRASHLDFSCATVKAARLSSSSLSCSSSSSEPPTTSSSSSDSGASSSSSSSSDSDSSASLSSSSSSESAMKIVVVVARRLARTLRRPRLSLGRLALRPLRLRRLALRRRAAPRRRRRGRLGRRRRGGARLLGVVDRAARGVGEDLVGFVDLLECFSRVLLGALVRVDQCRDVPVGDLDVAVRRRRFDAEDVVQRGAVLERARDDPAREALDRARLRSRRRRRRGGRRSWRGGAGRARRPARSPGRRRAQRRDDLLFPSLHVETSTPRAAAIALSVLTDWPAKSSSSSSTSTTAVSAFRLLARAAVRSASVCEPVSSKPSLSLSAAGSAGAGAAAGSAG